MVLDARPEEDVMNRLVSKIMPVLVLLAVAVVGALGPGDVRSVAQAAPGPQEALIVNPASNPARTTIVGPVTATIANTQAIPVTVEGTPSVAVSGSVTVANSEAQAIPVRDVRAGATAWVGGGQLIINPGEEFESEQFFAPPPGQRLVIEAVSIDAFLPAGQIATEATVLTSAAGEGAIFRFPMPSLPSAIATHDHFGTAQLTKLNVSGGVIVSVSRNATTGTGIVNVALSGVLVDE